MSFLLAILPQNRDISTVFDCLRKFEIQFQVKSNFEELTPFAESYASGKEINAKVKEEIDSSPVVDGDAVPSEAGQINDRFPMLFDNRELYRNAFNAHNYLLSETDVEEESIADLPIVGRDNTGSPGDLNEGAMGEMSDCTPWNMFEDGAVEDEEDMGQMLEIYDYVNHVSEEKTCPVDGCSEFISSEDLVDHMKKHPAPWICGVCKRHWPSRAVLREHYRKHTGERPFKCDNCEKTFTQRAVLRNHQRTHTGRPYECSTCHKRFAVHSKLTSHERSHYRKVRNSANYECDVCGFKTSRLLFLTNHRLTHVGEKPYFCKICGFKTAHKSWLDEHLKTH